MNKDNPPTWVAPYSYKRFGTFGYAVYFEDDLMLSWHLFKNDASTYAAQLNGAYNLGRSSMMFEV